jgi:colanic acid biosynthesis glycosyl transferase WcaI
MVGDGAARRQLSDAAARAALPHLQILPLLSPEDHQALLQAADVGLVSQAAGTGQYFFPSKVLTMLAAGLPLITVSDIGSELADAVQAGGFGVNVPAEDSAGLADALLSLANNPELLGQLRRSTHWVSQFDRNRVLSEFEARLRLLA